VSNAPLVTSQVDTLDYAGHRIRVLRHRGREYVVLRDVSAIFGDENARGWAGPAFQPQIRAFRAFRVTKTAEVLTATWNSLYAILAQKNGIPEDLITLVKNRVPGGVGLALPCMPVPPPLPGSVQEYFQIGSPGSGVVTLLVRGRRLRARAWNNQRYYSTTDAMNMMGIKVGSVQYASHFPFAKMARLSLPDRPNMKMVFVDETALRRIIGMVSNEASSALLAALDAMPVIPGFNERETTMTTKPTFGPYAVLVVPERDIRVDRDDPTCPVVVPIKPPDKASLPDGAARLMGYADFELSNRHCHTTVSLYALCEVDRRMLIESLERLADLLRDSLTQPSAPATSTPASLSLNPGP
jgi:hypothetical protein